MKLFRTVLICLHQFRPRHPSRTGIPLENGCLRQQYSEEPPSDLCHPITDEHKWWCGACTSSYHLSKPIPGRSFTDDLAKWGCCGVFRTKLPRDLFLEDGLYLLQSGNYCIVPVVASVVSFRRTTLRRTPLGSSLFWRTGHFFNPLVGFIMSRLMAQMGASSPRDSSRTCWRDRIEILSATI